jgi:hypothetical protein
MSLALTLPCQASPLLLGCHPSHRPVVVVVVVVTQGGWW